jgi:hypothetical protein
VEPKLSSLLKTEVLHGVRHVNYIAVDAGRFQRLVEKSPGGADEGATLSVFLIARRLADEKQFASSGAFAENGLSGVLVEVAAAAFGGGATQRCQI